MKILVLSAEKNYEVNRIIDESNKRGHETNFLLLSKCKSPDPQNYDCVLFRQIEKNVVKAEGIAKKFFDAGKIVVDEKIIHKIDRDKMQNYKLFTEHGLYVPATCPFNKKNLKLIEKFPSEEIVLKPLSGKRGKGLKKIKKAKLKKYLKTLKGQKYIAQEFAEITDEYRVYVIGNKVIGGVKKESDFWIHNLSQGAEPKKTHFSRGIKNTAIRAAKSVQTQIAGIDIGRTKKRKLFIIEVNRSPGFKGYESLDYNFAEKIVKYLEKKSANKPEHQT